MECRDSTLDPKPYRDSVGIIFSCSLLRTSKLKLRPSPPKDTDELWQMFDSAANNNIDQDL